MSVSEPSSRVSEANPCSAGGRAGAERTKAKSSAVMETPGLGAARGGPTGTNLVCIDREVMGSQALAGPWLGLGWALAGRDLAEETDSDRWVENSANESGKR